MSRHLSDDQLINFIYQTLPEGEREALKGHLATCPACRVDLADYEALQHRLHYSVIARRSQISPSAQMTFAAIAPRLKRSGVRQVVQYSNQLLSGLATLTLLIVLGAGLIFLLSNISWPVVEPSVQVNQATAISTVEVRQPVIDSPAEPGSVEFVWQITGDPHPLSGPADVAVDSQGNLYVIDSRNYRLQKFDRNGQFLTMWGGRGVGDGQFDFTAPAGFAGGAVAVDQQGYIYVADPGNTRIQKFDGNGQFLTKWGGRGLGDGQFSQPAGLAIDRLGYIYAADANRHDIQKFDSQGQFLTRWGSRGLGEGQFNVSAGLAVDEKGNVYVTDWENHRVQKSDSNGQFLAMWGSSGLGNGQFNTPRDVIADAQGNIYVVDDTTNRVQIFANDGQFLTQWGSRGAGNGQFNLPSGLGVDGEGYVYVADYGNNRVQKFRPPGVE